MNAIYALAVFGCVAVLVVCEDSADCFDRLRFPCAALKEVGGCDHRLFQPTAWRNCRKTCAMCDLKTVPEIPPPAPGCSDQLSKRVCKKYKKRNQCQQFKEAIWKCSLTCETCP
ncbi:hypothetical protein Tcan_15312 [Toxocara canis]|uniref:ShKT domain-containing protein n=1 Tax=Toxocara canis TaxID=6265 RepID=A0A0B2VWV2_TOXCA|nr:hypothetical protein Tcan_15312 [Toxocara canis]